jgi:cytochrome c peroxidase
MVMKKIYRFLTLILSAVLVLFISQCKPENNDGPKQPDYQDELYNLQVPRGFPPPIIDPNNPLTVNGVVLGRKLFYDPILSGDNTQACASCHDQSTSFTDAPLRFSKGIDGFEGDKNSMALINLAWNRDFFWDGRSPSLEDQTLDPVRNPIEMHEEWKDAVAKLQAKTEYVELFKKAFGTEQVDSLLAGRAIAQFLKTIIVSQSKFQKSPNLAGFTPAERRGFDIFIREDKGDCLHCHPTDGTLFTSNYFDNPVQRFHNNGLDSEAMAGVLTGRALITKDRADNGKFKAPTLLNIELTPPYMHDGRFNTLEEVIEFYNSGVFLSSTLDPNMNIKPGANNRIFEDGKRKLNLTQQEKDDLLAFLKTLTDPTLATNPDFSKP